MFYIVAGLIALLLLWSTRCAFTASGYTPCPYKNPYRRFCKACGQCQVQYTRPWRSNSWWEANGKIINETCSCHNDCETHRDLI